MNVRRTAAALTSAAALSVSGVAMATPASAQQNGLVNVNVSNVSVLDQADIRVLNNLLRDANVNVGIAAAVVATVCDVNVGGILGTLEDTGSATCTSAEGATVTLQQVAG